MLINDLVHHINRRLFECARRMMKMGINYITRIAKEVSADLRQAEALKAVVA